VRIGSRARGFRGVVSAAEDAVRFGHMITKDALRKTKMLIFAEKYGIHMALEAFEVKRRTFFAWKKAWISGGRRPEALNLKSRTPKARRKRLWPEEVLEEIRRLRFTHPNLGPEKIHPLLSRYCQGKELHCPRPKTIGRLLRDLGGLRQHPEKLSHFGKRKILLRRKVLRKPKDFRAGYPGHCVALDTIEKHIRGTRRYLVTFEDIYTRYAFAWATSSHASRAAKEFFDLCRRVFPFPMTFVLTDNGSEFMKDFEAELFRLHLIHYHTYPKTPKMNAHMERFNRTLQEEFADYHIEELLLVDTFNAKLMDYLVWYNTERVHHAFRNKLSPVQFLLDLPQSARDQLPAECKDGWPHT
jgi:transposase InsO family protein